MSDFEHEGNAEPSVHVDPNSLAGMLWLWSRVIMLHRTGRAHLPTTSHNAALKFVNIALEFLQIGLSRWAVAQKEPSTAQMIALQKAHRRTHPGILARLMEQTKKGKQIRSWKKLGLQVDSKAQALNYRMAAQYFWVLRRQVVGPLAGQEPALHHGRRSSVQRIPHQGWLWR